MEQMTQAIDAATSPAVQMWMNWMVVIFVVSILFVRRYPAARVVLAGFVLSAVAGIVIFKITGKVYLIGLSHILIWTPLAIYLLRYVLTARNFRAQSMFGGWIILLLATIIVSLLFDYRDVTMVLLGHR